MRFCDYATLVQNCTTKLDPINYLCFVSCSVLVTCKNMNACIENSLVIKIKVKDDISIINGHGLLETSKLTLKGQCNSILKSSCKRFLAIYMCVQEH